VLQYAQKEGYTANVEMGSFGSRNIVIGNPEKADVLVTAHYDTCAWMPIPNLITPCNLLPFLGYQAFITFLILGIAFVIGLCGYHLN